MTTIMTATPKAALLLLTIKDHGHRLAAVAGLRLPLLVSAFQRGCYAE